MRKAAAAGTGALVRGLQERAARAFPADRVECRDGWWLRHCAGAAWWAGSVLPHRDAPAAELPDRIATVEDFYAGHRSPARFQISPGAGPAGLDGLLDRRGYGRQSPMSLQWAATADVAARVKAGGLRVRLDERPTQSWFATWLAVHGTGADPGLEWDMLRRVELPGAYVSVLAGAGVVAVGRAVAEAGWAGVFGMATLPPARGRGAAGQVLAALAGWAAGHRAARLFLQVECDNTVGQRLYGRAGFTELCRYHYRIRAAPPAAD